MKRIAQVFAVIVVAIVIVMAAFGSTKKPNFIDVPVDARVSK